VVSTLEACSRLPRLGCARRTAFPERGGPLIPLTGPAWTLKGSSLTGRSLFVLANFLSNGPKLMELVNPPSSYFALG
jgi:hypothetical protein